MLSWMKRLAPSFDAAITQRGVWPTLPQQILLQAALLDAPVATDAWLKWQEMVQTDAIDAASWKLIPLVYVNLKRLGFEDPLLLQARECHLHHWRSNQRLFQQTAVFLDQLERLKIPVLVLKGVALAHLYYPDTGSRPMADLDLLVPAGKFSALCVKLIDAGWKATTDDFESFRMDQEPSFGLMRPDGFWVDIHCHVLHVNCTQEADEEFWVHAQSWTLRQRAALTLAPEDHLLHVICHGVRWCDVPPFRWMADAWWILAGSHDSFDWERFLRQVRFHQVNLEVFRGLELMNRITPLEFPPNLLARLAAIPASGDVHVRFILNTSFVPAPFFARACAIWNAAGKGAPVYSLDGRPKPSGRDLLARRDIRCTLALLLYACKILARMAGRFAQNLARAWRGGSVSPGP
jgi:hypothetical protein